MGASVTQASHDTDGAVRARWLPRLGALLLVVGVGAAVWGVAYAINGMTQAHGYVTVPVQVAGPVGGRGGDVHVELRAPGDDDGGLAQAAAEAESVLDRVGGWLATAEPTDGLRGAGVDGELRLRVWDSTRLEQLLARGDTLVTGLGTLVVALLLRPLLRDVASGAPFARGNARRVQGVAAAVGLAGVAAPVLPQIAASLVLGRTGLTSTGAFVTGLTLDPAPLVVAAVVLAVAAAFREGERLTRDVEGLV